MWAVRRRFQSSVVEGLWRGGAVKISAFLYRESRLHVLAHFSVCSELSQIPLRFGAKVSVGAWQNQVDA